MAAAPPGFRRCRFIRAGPVAIVAHGAGIRPNSSRDRFLSSSEGRKALATVPPRTQIEQAQEKAFDAWEADGEARYRMAREALALDERCSDAWLILAEREQTWAKQRKCFGRAVALSSRAASDEGWLKLYEEETAADGKDGPAGGLYGSVVARPFLRARMALARCFMDGGYHEESRALYEELEMDEIQALARLLRRYAKDATACLAFERLWLALAQGATPRTAGPLPRGQLDHSYLFSISPGETTVSPCEQDMPSHPRKHRIGAIRT